MYFNKFTMGGCHGVLRYVKNQEEVCLTTVHPSAIYSYQIEYYQGKYVPTPIMEVSKPFFSFKYQPCHYEKFVYFHRKVIASYTNVKIKCSYLTYHYHFQSRYIMDEFMQQLLHYMNDTVYLKCVGCNTLFNTLKKCVTHKKSCFQLWELTSTEKNLLDYTKSTVVKNESVYIIDKQKEIVYYFEKDKIDARPIKTVHYSEENFDTPKQKYLKDYETDKYIIYVPVNKKIASVSREKIEKLIGISNLKEK